MRPGHDLNIVPGLEEGSVEDCACRPWRKRVATESTLGKIRLENQDIIKCQVKFKLAEKQDLI